MKNSYKKKINKTEWFSSMAPNTKTIRVIEKIYIWY